MIRRYLINYQDNIIALKYDVSKKSVAIGANGKFESVLIKIMEYYFSESYQSIWTQKNKIRLVTKIEPKEFNTIIDRIQNDGIVLQIVNSLGRIMR